MPPAQQSRLTDEEVLQAFGGAPKERLTDDDVIAAFGGKRTKKGAKISFPEQKPASAGEAFFGSMAEGVGHAMQGTNIALTKMANMATPFGPKIEGIPGYSQAADYMVKKGEGIYPPELRESAGLPQKVAGLAGSLVPGLAAEVVNPAAAAITFGMQFGAPAYLEVKKETGSETKAMAAFIGEAAIAQLNQLGFGGKIPTILGKLVKANKATGGGLMRLSTLGHIAGAAAKGQGVMAAQAGLSAALNEHLTGNDREILKEMVAAATSPEGAIVGGGLETLKVLSQHARSAKASKKAQETTSPKKDSEVKLEPMKPKVPQEEASAPKMTAVEGATPIPTDLAERPVAPNAAEVPKEPPKAEPTTTEPEKPTGIKNAEVARRREQMGLEQREEPKVRTREALHAEAKAALEADPRVAEKLVSDLEATPRAVTDSDDALLAFESRRLVNEVTKADERYIQDPTESNKKSADAAQAAYDRAGDVFDAAGTASGRALNARKIMLEEDYSLAAIKRKLRKAKGGEDLTPAEQANVAETHKKLVETQKAHGEYVTAAEQKQAEQAAEISLLRLTKKVKGEARRGKKKTAVAEAKAEIEASIQRLASISQKARAGPLDPELILETGKLAKASLKYGYRKFNVWADEMASRAGEHIRPYLKKAWDSAHAASQEDLARPIAEKLAAGKHLSEISSDVEAIARGFVEQGVTELGPLIDAVHGVTSKTNPELSKENIRDAFSRYGQFRRLSKEEVAAKLRDLKGQSREVAKLEDLTKGQKPKKTGFERPVPSQTQKRLQKKVRDLQEYIGLKPVSAAEGQKKALAALKSSLRTQIGNLEYQIESETMALPKAAQKGDVETAALRAELEAIKKDYKETFFKEIAAEDVGKALARTEAALARHIDVLKNRIASLQVAAREPKSGPTNDAIERLKEQRDSLTMEIKGWREAYKPNLTPEQRALKIKKAAIKRSIAEYERRITEKDFSPKETRKPVQLDEEALKLKATEIQLKQKLELAREAARRERRGIAEKARDVALEALDSVTALESSFDNSAVLRQNLFFTTIHPIKSFANIKKMLRAFASKEGAAVADAYLKEHPDYARAVASGIKFKGTDAKLGAVEEEYRTNLAERIPVIGGVVKASNRSFVAYQNLQSFMAFNAMADALPGKASKVDLQNLAYLTNIGTGRAAGRAEALAAAVGKLRIFWAPSLAISRFQLLAEPLRVAGSRKMSFKAKRIVANRFARFVLGRAVWLYMVSKAMNLFTDDEKEKASIEKDPRSSDFLKIRIGRLREDTLGGIGQVATFISRMVTGKTKSTKSGKVRKLENTGKPFDQTRGTVAGRFLRSKVSPIFGRIIDALTEEDFQGNKLTPAEALTQPPIPLAIKDAYDAMKELGIPRGAILAILSHFGEGLAVYDDKKTKKKTKK